MLLFPSLALFQIFLGFWRRLVVSSAWLSLSFVTDIPLSTREPCQPTKTARQPQPLPRNGKRQKANDNKTKRQTPTSFSYDALSTMPAKLSFTLSHPLPPGLPPDRVVQALHRYETLITPNPYLVSFRRRPVDLREIVDDAFFREDGNALAAFEIVDRIVLVPGLATKKVVIPCVMQRFEGGMRCRSLAAGGVRVWCTWRVRPRGGGGRRATNASRQSSCVSDDDDNGSRLSLSTAATTPPATPPSAHAPDGYELVEESQVECSSFVKPFVGRSFQSAHLTILRTVVLDIMKSHRAEA